MLPLTKKHHKSFPGKTLLS